VEQITLEDIRRALEVEDNRLIPLIYRELYPKVKGFVRQNSGTSADARDVLHDAFLAFLTKMKSDKHMQLTCNISTYLFAICRNLWLKRLNNRKRYSHSAVICEPQEEFLNSMEEEILRNQEYLIYLDHFSALGRLCRSILELFYNYTSFEEIALRLGLGDGDNARKRKYRCKQLLINRIRRDVRYQQLKEL